MRILTSALLVFAVTALAHANGNNSTNGNFSVRAEQMCPGGWTMFGGRCFQYVPRPLSWIDAEKNCQSLRSNLVSVRTVEENNFIQMVIFQSTQDFVAAWIGGYKCHEFDTWLWDDGTHFSFTFWCPGEPNGYRDRTYCLQMNDSGKKCWDDILCSNRLPSVCSFKI